MKQEILTIRENVPVTGCVYRMRLEGAELEAQYKATLEKLGQQ